MYSLLVLVQYARCMQCSFLRGTFATVTVRGEPAVSCIQLTYGAANNSSNKHMLQQLSAQCRPNKKTHHDEQKESHNESTPQCLARTRKKAKPEREATFFNYWTKWSQKLCPRSWAVFATSEASAPSPTKRTILIHVYRLHSSSC